MLAHQAATITGDSSPMPEGAPVEASAAGLAGVPVLHPPPLTTLEPAATAVTEDAPPPSAAEPASAAAAAATASAPQPVLEAAAAADAAAAAVPPPADLPRPEHKPGDDVKSALDQARLPGKTDDGGATGSVSKAEAAAAGGDGGGLILPVEASSKYSCLYWLTRARPTNYDMLMFRTLNRDLKMPNANDDYLADRIRDELMPVRGWCLRNLPWTKHQAKAALENSVFGVPGCINFIDARTKWFDLAVNEATTVKQISQVVIIAAGYDTRPYRLAQPGVQFFEVDLPVASERKRKLVTKLGFVRPGGRQPVYVAADLSKVDLKMAMQGTGFDPSKPALFTIEGLIYYLPEAAAHRLVDSVSNLAAPGSMLYFDYMQVAALNGNGKDFPGFLVTAQAVANKGEPYLFGLENTPEAVQQFVGLRGFRLQQHLTPRAMLELMLPHVKWNDRVPPIASFYSYAAVMKQ